MRVVVTITPVPASAIMPVALSLPLYPGTLRDSHGALEPRRPLRVLYPRRWRGMPAPEYVLRAREVLDRIPPGGREVGYCVQEHV